MTTLISGGRLFDGERELADHAVLIDGATIKRVAPLSEFSGYSGQRIDAKGATVLPGLIDCHVHMLSGAEGNPGIVLDKMSVGDIVMRGLQHMQATLAGGITAVRDCGGKDYLEFSVRDACNSGRQLGPTIMASGRMICMTGGHGNKNGRVADGVDEVVKAVREQIHAGSDLIKIMATGGVMTPGVNPEDAHYSAEEMAAGIHEGHRFHRHCASHAQGAEGILNAVRGGIDSIEHGIFMNDECIEEMLKRGTWLVPTLAAVKNILRGHDEGEPGIPDYVIEKSKRVYAVHQEAFKMYYKAGGKIAMGTDSGTPFNRHGENAMELEYMHEMGMSNRDALHASTASAADLMRRKDIGRLAEGKSADVLLVEGNALADIKAVSRRDNHRLVIKRGIVVRDRRSNSQGAMLLNAAAGV
jgi:imidazolonepropionase-like amidohydrolase